MYVFLPPCSFYPLSFSRSKIIKDWEKQEAALGRIRNVLKKWRKVKKSISLSKTNQTPKALSNPMKMPMTNPLAQKATTPEASRAYIPAIPKRSAKHALLQSKKAKGKGKAKGASKEETVQSTKEETAQTKIEETAQVTKKETVQAIKDEKLITNDYQNKERGTMQATDQEVSTKTKSLEDTLTQSSKNRKASIKENCETNSVSFCLFLLTLFFYVLSLVHIKLIYFCLLFSVDSSVLRLVNTNETH